MRQKCKREVLLKGMISCYCQTTHTLYSYFKLYSMYLSGGHSIGREERSNKELISSIEELIHWSEEYEDMVDMVQDIFATVLDTDRKTLSSTADFFELGGSSLDTIALISRIESTVGIQSK